MKPIIIKNKKKLGYTPSKSIITPRDEKSIDLYFSDINKLDASLMTKEEEVEFFNKIIQGDDSAKRKVILANLKFVVSVAKTYINYGLEFADLISEGNIGLIKAVDKFDPSRNIIFISYAVWWIRQSILQAITEKGKLVRIPVNMSESLNKVNMIVQKLEHQLQRTATIDEIVEHAREINLKNNNNSEITSDNITNILLSKISTSSLDEPFFGKNGEEDGSYYDIIPATGINVVSNIEMIENEIKDLLSNSGLTRRERNIIEMSYGVLRDKRYNLEEIAAMYSVSREAIRQVSEKALRKLRNNPKITILFDYALNND